MLVLVVLSFLHIITSSSGAVPPEIEATTIMPPQKTTQGPPNPSNVASMARYIIHNSDWASIATISTLRGTKHYPFVNLKSLSDGPPSNGTGVPYLYMTQLDLTGKDVEKNNRVTLMVTLAQSDYCKSQSYDPQDPRCGRTIITGRLLKIPQHAPDYQFAKDSLFSRHPEMSSWPKDHQFYVAKINIEQVLVLDQFGGVKYVSVDDYFHPSEEFFDTTEFPEIRNENEIFVFNILK